MLMSEEKKSTFGPKRPQAEKRHIQSKKKRARNRSNKSMMSTAIRLLKKSDPSQDSSSLLNKAFSLIDKACKKGVIKRNKANRIKSRISVQTKESKTEQN